jgi:hypothetical protein
VKPDCQHSFGCSAANRMQEDFGRLRGSRTTRLRAARYRAIVAAETVTWYWCRRCQAMVSGPASRPWPVRSFRSRTIRSTVSRLIAFGEAFGRRDRGSNAASPSAWYLASSAQIQDRATP